MEAVTPSPPKPALLMRRINPMTSGITAMISRDPAAPMLRFQVELARGSLVVTLAAALEDEATIQWTQNGTPIKGQTGPSLHLAGLTADDGDVYYAVLRTSQGETRSQSFLVVVIPGNSLINLSTRGHVSIAKPLIVGFVVGRASGPIKPKRYLIRAIGTSLRRFGVTETLARPAVALHKGQSKKRDLERSDEQVLLAREWQPKVGAFALDADASDLVAVVELESGAYSLVVTGGEGEEGHVLVEVYEIPI